MQSLCKPGQRLACRRDTSCITGRKGLGVNRMASSLFEKRGALAGVELGSRAADGQLEGFDFSIFVQAPHGTVQVVTAECTFGEEPDEAEALFGLLTPQVLAHFAGTVEKKTSKLVTIRVDEPPSTVRLSHFRDAQEGFDSVKLEAVLDAGAVPAVAADDVGFDVAAVSRALATRAFAAERIAPIAIKVFTRYDGDAEWAAVLAAAAKEHASRKADIIAAVLRACPWGELKYGENGPANKLLRGLLPATVAYRPVRKLFPEWAKLTQTDLFATIEMLQLPVADRAEAAARVYRALELGDDNDLHWVRGRIKPPSTFVYAIFDGSDEIEARLFGLIADTVPDELEQLMLPLRASTSNAARAATTWLLQQRRLDPVAVSVKASSDWQLASESFATWFALIKREYPQHFDAVVARFAEVRKLYNPDLIQAVCGAVGESVSKTVFRLGSTEFKTTSRNVTAGPAKPKATRAKPKS